MFSQGVFASTGSWTHGAQAAAPASRTSSRTNAAGRKAAVASATRLRGRPQRAEVTCRMHESTTPACARPPKKRKLTSSACHARVLSRTRPTRKAAPPSPDRPSSARRARGGSSAPAAVGPADAPLTALRDGSAPAAVGAVERLLPSSRGGSRSAAAGVVDASFTLLPEGSAPAAACAVDASLSDWSGSGPVGASFTARPPAVPAPARRTCRGSGPAPSARRHSAHRRSGACCGRPRG